MLDTQPVPGVEAVVVNPRVVIRTDVRVPIKIRGVSGPRTMVQRPLLLRPEAEAAALEDGHVYTDPRRWRYRTPHS